MDQASLMTILTIVEMIVVMIVKMIDVMIKIVGQVSDVMNDLVSKTIDQLQRLQFVHVGMIVHARLLVVTFVMITDVIVRNAIVVVKNLKNKSSLETNQLQVSTLASTKVFRSKSLVLLSHNRSRLSLISRWELIL